MLTNKRDGSRLQAETVQEILDRRFAVNKFANVSDILGSDWGMAYGYEMSLNFHGDELAYQAEVRRRVNEIYPTAQ